MEKANDKLRVAEQLLQSGAYDDAVSRAYYSAFHATQAVLLTEGLTANTHRALVNLFGLHLVKTGKLPARLGKFLANLKDDRESSDYEIYSAIDQETAQRAVQEAKAFLAAAEQYLKPWL
ncbi:MAG: HEPN domain-containing protein [Candidatus Omnitrophica bacterium]|nr:HEPN domain-containing protein [Candidatus Omnitrophota bacterium]